MYIICYTSCMAAYILFVSIKDTDIVIGSMTKTIREKIDSACGTLFGMVVQPMVVCWLMWIAHWASAPSPRGKLWYGVYCTFALGELVNIVDLGILLARRITGSSST